MANHPDWNEPASWRGIQPALTVRLSGPGIPPGRISTDDLIPLLRALVDSLERLASREIEGRPSLRPGPRTRVAKSRVALYLRSVGEGSAVLGFEAGSAQRGIEGVRLGWETVAEWVSGLDQVGRGEARPESFDRGVLSAFGPLRPMLDRGIDEIDFSFESGTTLRKAKFDRGVSRQIEEHLKLPARNRRTFEGIILEADFHAPDIEFTLYTTGGEALRCSAPEEDMSAVLGSLLRFVRVSGDALEDTETKRVKRLRADAIEIVDLEVEGIPIGSVKEFWTGVELSDLLERQGVAPFDPDEPITWEPPTRDELDRLLRAIAREGEETEET